MHRIDGPGAASGGSFTEGNPTTGTPATVVTAAFMNAIQEELVAVATSAGAALNKPSNDQVITAIRALIAASAVPPGAVLGFSQPTAPAGWLVADGSAVSRTVYAALFARIGTMHGAGNGTTTFNLPDLRGEFIRGWDAGRGVDAGRTFGSWQTDSFKTHQHTVPRDGRTPGAIDSAGVGSESGGTPDNTGAASGGYDFKTLVNSDGGGAETRPRNVALLVCIKT